ncbi:MAG: dihydropteroate synthase [Anaerolineaceae bacterium]|jgi:5-methyltetrahydrofolate--homocysteine methyltransferase|nr:dihydropteroate synthase [Anaerolineaceae bacterium]
MATRLTSTNGDIYIGQNLPTVLINDQLRIIDQSPEIFEQLQKKDVSGLLEIAQSGQADGIDMVDILIIHQDLDEIDLLPRIAWSIKKEVGCPISLDSRNVEALSAALEAIAPDKALINSVSAEKEVLAAILPVAKKYGAAMVGMPIGDTYGLTKVVDERVFEAQVIIDACEGMGIPKEDLVMDGVCLSSSAEPDTFEITLQTLRRFQHELQISTTLGIGNAGFGMPDQTVIDLAYLIGAIPWGLHSAIVDPKTQGLVKTVRAMDFLMNHDIGGKRYIKWWRSARKIAAIHSKEHLKNS